MSLGVTLHSGILICRSKFGMGTPTIEELYSCYDKLCDTSADKDQKELAYKSIIQGTKGDENTKRLSSQFIAKFSKLFSDSLEESFSCFLDLCDDDDVNVRKQAVHDLVQFCKHSRTFVPRVADVLVQLYQTDDKKEFTFLSVALSQLLHLEPKPTLLGIFNQLLSANTESPREPILKFLSERLKTLPDTVLTNDVETFVVEQINRVLHDVSEEEFHLLISLLSSLKCMSTLIGRQKLVGIITQQALQAVPVFNVHDRACIAQICASCKQAALCVSKNVNAHELLMYIFDKVMPQICNFSEDSFDERLNLLRLSAELFMFPSPEMSNAKVEDIRQYMTSVFSALSNFLPDVPSDDKMKEDTKSCSAALSLKFSELEALLYLSCQFGKYHPQFFGGYNNNEDQETDFFKEGKDRLKTLRPRLQYLSRIAQEYAATISSQLGKDLQSEESKLKVMAHKLMMNIQSMVRYFFHNPPMFKNINVSLSWVEKSSPLTPGVKRPAAVIETGSENQLNSRQSRADRPLYTPPVGQWSRNEMGNSQNNRRRFNRGRGRARIY